VLRWKSYFEPEKTVLMTNVQDSVFQLFQRVENKVIFTITHVISPSYEYTVPKGTNNFLVLLEMH
jgi:hypothetical protein